MRFCVDYRLVDRKTIRDSYALPRIDELRDNLIGAKYFPRLGLRSGYYVEEIEEDRKSRRAVKLDHLVLEMG